jgi:TrpR-related protein YerC/YecD
MTEQNKQMQQLMQAIAGLESPEACARFFEDLCTIRELQDMAQRFETALLLDEGRNYQEISRRIGISTATISRVNRSLNYGSGGYREVIAEVRAKGARKDADR